ncbi:TPA: diguanylate cyclase [Vibrio vulnificus]|uniref:diguanylate cyclase n=1 Tax=Vibrio vulnificus TaxID=672 RepID=UPI0005F17B29|nr:diguanylate cyclase [Vibrio vulnificus]EGQ7963638.1 diguanylate cyclase [Vibrio vulnificus]EHU4913399.1 diguanylate cyclase [Vibrio vulnificus]EKA7352954.1 diguanylate cyclase [Vibrio vulnificus]MCA3914259.1 diguanylate cyclase [Vibrio vulnificus]MCG6313850.1 diguanylate cyclase [Vibrio vulnificus]
MGFNKILIIDDEIINLQVLSDILRPLATIHVAKSGKQGVRKAIQYQPDLILLDVNMEKMDGFETLKQLKRESVTESIPIIFISAMTDYDHEERGLLLGAADYIFKPFYAGIVKARVSVHLELVKQREQLELLASNDFLTQVANRRRYDIALKKEWLRSKELKTPLSLAIFDIDDFKKFNDEFGHSAGDELLVETAAILKSVFFLNGYLVSRYGGEEFAVIMQNTEQEFASVLVNKCLNKVEEDIGVTFSAGVVTCIPTDDIDVKQFFQFADEELYKSKLSGKNKLSCISV